MELSLVAATQTVSYTTMEGKGSTRLFVSLFYGNALALTSGGGQGHFSTGLEWMSLRSTSQKVRLINFYNLHFANEL